MPEGGNSYLNETYVYFTIACLYPRHHHESYWCHLIYILMHQLFVGCAVPRFS